MNVSEFIFDYLSKKGIDTAFMVTGGQAMWLNDAIGKNGNYKIICTHHEQSAAMSADAYGRINNKPSVVLVTAGPGAINALNGVVGGYTDSSPMIVISGQAALPFVKYQEKTGIRQYGVQGIYIKNIVEHIVKYFVTIDDPQKTKYYLEKALFEATSERPGPVWIEVPLDIQNAQIDIKYLEEFANVNNKDFGKIKQTVKYTYNEIKKAKKPVFLVGQGVKLAGANEVFYNFINKIRIPVLTSRLGIDLIESNNDLYVGRPGNYGERSANFAIQNSDLIISVGCRLASSLVGHNAKEFGKNAKIICVDVDKNELDKPGPIIEYKANIDCKDFFETMMEVLDNNSIPSFDNWIARCNSWKNKYPVVLDEYKKENPINSYYFLDRLSFMAKDNAAIMIDTGSCFHVACQTWKIKKGQKFLTTGGISSMGYWAACLGACVANNKQETIVVTGDGSFQMNIQELATIKHNNLPIKIFIIDNDGYLLIRHTQRNFMNDRFIGEGPDTGVWCPDSIKVAEAYGIKAVSINSPEEIDNKIKETLNYDGPVLCNVKCSKWQLLIPRITSDRLPDGTLKSRNYEDMYPFLSEEELKANMSDD